MPPPDDLLDRLTASARTMASTTINMNAVQRLNPPQARSDAALEQRTSFPYPIFDDTTRAIAQTQDRIARASSAIEVAPTLAPYLADRHTYGRIADDLPAMSAVAAALNPPAYTPTAAESRQWSARYGVLTAPAPPRPTPINALLGIWENFRAGGTMLGSYLEQSANHPEQLFNSDLINGTVNAVFGPPAADLRYVFHAPPPTPGLLDRLATAMHGQPGISVQSDSEREAMRAQIRAANADPAFTSWYMRDIYSGASSAAQLAPGLVASILTRSSGPVLAYGGAQQASSAYYRYRARGASELEAQQGARAEGAIEVAGEYLPMSWLVDKMGRIGVGHFLTGLLGRELPTEVATTVAQNAVDTAIANPNTTWNDYLAAQPAEIRQTIVGTIMQALFLGGPAHFMHAHERAVADDQAMQSVDQVMGAAAGSTVRRELPEQFHQIVSQVAQGSHIENIYVPAEAVRSLFQSPEDLHHDEFWGRYSDQVDEASALGGDVVIPIADAATHLAGTPQWEQLREHVRATPGGESRAEAEAAPDQAQRVGEEAAGHIDAERASWEPVQHVYEEMHGKLLAAGFTSEAATHLATQFAQRAATRAARLGQALTGDEASKVDVRHGDAPAGEGRSFSQSSESKSDGRPIVGDLPHEGLAPANVGLDGRIYVGGIGQGHVDVIERFPDVEWGGGTGFVTPDGRFLNRVEALAWTKANGEHIRPSENMRGGPAGDELDALDYRDQSELVPPPFWSTRRAEWERKAALRLGSATPLAQRIFNQQERGRISFTEDGKSVIDLFKASDLSTFIHETGHLYLEELARDAQIALELDTPEAHQLVADFEAVKAWFKREGHEVGADGTIPTEAHELFARGFERFTMEGKAPSSALRRAFDAFRSWLLTIYKHVENLRAPITPEIRDVMARLLATDEEIAMAAEEQNIRALFKTADEAGMTKAEFAAYEKATQGARDEAHDALLYRVMAPIRAEKEKAWRAERDAVKAEVSDEIDQQPVFKALRLLRTGKIGEEEAQPVKLDRQHLIDAYGEDALSRMPPSVPPIYGDKNTANADDIAERVGFPSGDAMIRTLMGHEETRKALRDAGDKRSPRQVAIENETASRMTERHGDPLNDGSIEEEARALIHNDQQGEVIASELRALNRKRRAGSDPNRAPLPYEIARRWAADKVNNGKVAEVLSGAALQQYERAARKAGKLAEAAMLKGDIGETYRQKQAQMLNTALISEARKAKDIVDAAVKRMQKTAGKRTIASVDQDYLDQAHALLEEVDFRTRSQRDVTKQESFEAWAAAQRAEGRDIIVPDSYALTLGKTNWTHLSVEQIKGLDDTVKQILHLGRLKQSLIDGGKRRAHEEVVGEAVDAAGKLPPKPPSDLMEPSFGDRLKARVASVDGALLKLETIFDWLDGGDSNGVFNRVAFRPIAEAQDRENDMLADYYGRVRAAMGEVPKEDLRRWGDRVTVPELANRETGNPFTFTRQQLVALALNMGNEGNAQRVTDGYGWNQAAVMAALNRELTPAEWQFAQKIWDILDTLYPHIAELERKVNGFEPDKVEARPLETSAGTLRGGYYPVIYDSARNLDAEKDAARSGDLFEATYTKASTRAGATNERAAKVSRPVLLQIGVINRHLGEIIHDVTHREAIINAEKFLADRRVVKAVDDTLGPELRKQFRPWLKFVANSWAMERAGNEGLGKFATKARANATVVGMGFRISTILTQFAGYSNSFEAVGERWVAPAIAQAAQHPIESFNFVMERSGEVKHRMDTLDRDIRLSLQQLAGKRSPLTAAKRFAFHGIGYADRVVVIPTWIGAYNKALAAGMAEQDAIYAADKAVRVSQGAGSPKDLASVQRGTGKYGFFLQLSTMFYSYMSAFYQRERTLGRDVATAVRTRNIRMTPRLLARAWWLLVVPALLTELLAGRGPGDDEDWGAWIAHKLTSNVLGPIPFVRDLIDPAWDALAGRRPFAYQMSPVQRAGQSIVNVVQDAGREIHGGSPQHPVRDALEAGGYVTGLVPGQLASATQFLVDVGDGEQHPQSVRDWYDGLTKGHVAQH